MFVLELSKVLTICTLVATGVAELTCVLPHSSTNKKHSFLISCMPTPMHCTGKQVIFKLYRPAYIMHSTMHIQDSSGSANIGEIHERFHPVK